MKLVYLFLKSSIAFIRATKVTNLMKCFFSLNARKCDGGEKKKRKGDGGEQKIKKKR